MAARRYREEEEEESKMFRGAGITHRDALVTENLKLKRRVKYLNAELVQAKEALAHADQEVIRLIAHIQTLPNMNPSEE